MPLDTRFSNILVTGGAGFIGSHIVERLLEEGVEVTVVDNLLTGSLDNIAHLQDDENFHFVQGDLRDFNLVKALTEKVDAVSHQAALPSVTRSVKDPIQTNDVNVTGTLNLLRASVSSKVKRFIYASSSSVYGETETLPKSEEMTPQPISPYAVSKLAAELYSRVFYEVYGLETVCLRYFNVYGPRQKYGPYSGVITIFINQLLADQPPTIYGDGEQTRDFTNIQDVVEANMLALSTKKGIGEVFNIAAGRPTNVNRLAEMLLEIMGKTSLKPVFAAPRPGDIKHSYASTRKAETILGYEPKIQLREGLTLLTEWFVSRKRQNSSS